MPDKKITQLQPLSLTENTLFPIVTLGVTGQVNYATILDSIEGSINVSDALYTVTNLSANTTDDSTTSIMSYGVNVFTGVTSSNYATKLPQPVTGKTLKVVNKGSFTLYIYPSNVGGQINNLPIDTPAELPPDGKTYEFVCIVNPLPGEWTWDAPAINQLVFDELSVSHTNGSGTNRYGITQSGLSASSGAGLSSGNISLTGEWKTESFPATATRIKCYTNIVAADLSGVTNITTSLLTAYKNTGSNVTSGQRINLRFRGDEYYEGSVSAIGSLTPSPNQEIGDTSTFFYIDLPYGSNESKQLGTGGEFSNSYYTFAMFIGSAAATKTYKFKFVVEYY
jgi:hypothetical protein